MRSLPLTSPDDQNHVSFARTAPYLRAALLLGSGGGFALASILTLTPLSGIPLSTWWAALVQTHGRLQLFGWAGLFVVGIALYFLPRLRGAPLAWPALLPWVLGVLISSLILRFLSQTTARRDRMVPLGSPAGTQWRPGSTRSPSHPAHARAHHLAQIRVNKHSGGNSLHCSLYFERLCGACSSWHPQSLQLYDSACQQWPGSSHGRRGEYHPGFVRFSGSGGLGHVHADAATVCTHPALSHSTGKGAGAGILCRGHLLAAWHLLSRPASCISQCSGVPVHWHGDAHLYRLFPASDAPSNATPTTDHCSCSRPGNASGAYEAS